MLAQTFTGPEMSGLSYRAAGWKCCPELTSGRRSGVRRAVWLRPLASGGDADLRDHVLETEPAGERKIEPPACGGPNRRKGRTAKLTLRCAPVDLLPRRDRSA